MLSLFAHQIPFSFLLRQSEQRLFSPFYHIVTAHSAPHIQHLYQPRNIQQFEADLDFLLQHFQPISLDDLLQNKTSKKPRFFLSFDDGLREFYDFAAPILQQKGIPATVFLNSQFVDNQDLFFRYKASLLIDLLQKKQYSSKQLEECQVLFYKKMNLDLRQNQFKNLLKVRYHDRQILDDLALILNYNFQDFLNTYQPYLTSTQIQKLIADGFTFGAHSIDHPEYRFIPYDEQIRQTKNSLQTVQKKFSLDYAAFSFPFTDFCVSKSFFDESRTFLDISFGCAGLKIDPAQRHFQRFAMEGTNKSGADLIKEEYLAFILKRVIRKDFIKR